MTQKTLPQLNRMYVSMISYDPKLSNKFLGKSTQLYFFFLYYFQYFYKYLYIYDSLLWKVEKTYPFFWEAADSSYEQHIMQSRRNFTLMWKFYYLIYNYKTFFWWGNVYIYVHKDTLYLWSTYWQLWPKQKNLQKKFNKKYKNQNKTFKNLYNFVQFWLE